MDFMKLLKSIEELLYELVSWVIFYPLTLWRIIRDPLGSLAYAERELQEPEAQQYDDAVSPPILLLISLGVLHVLGTFITPPTLPETTGLLADVRNLLAFRAIAFSFFPLTFGLVVLTARRARITRSTFKPAFYSQCYATVPFVVSISIGFSLTAWVEQSLAAFFWGLAVLFLGLVWYGIVQTRWLAMSAKIRKLWAGLIVLGALLFAIPFFFFVAAVIGYAMSTGQVL